MAHDHANLDVVEADVVTAGPAEGQPVVVDDRDAGRLGDLLDVRAGAGVERADDQHGRALGDGRLRHAHLRGIAAERVLQGEVGRRQPGRRERGLQVRRVELIPPGGRRGVRQDDRHVALALSCERCERLQGAERGPDLTDE